MAERYTNEKNIISRNPSEAARQIFNQDEFEKDYSITRVPDELIQSSEFWIELINHDEKWIGMVPENLFEDQTFMESIDKVRFYQCFFHSGDNY